MEEKLLPKEEALYRAVGELIEEGADVNELKVSDITGRAGIGKGTAYEYFKNREDIISGAMIYQMDCICRQIEENFRRLDSFAGIMEYVLGYMDEEIKKRDCFIRYIHILSDNGPISKSLRGRIGNRETRRYTPGKLVLLMVEIGIKNGEIKGTLPQSFMCMEIGSKLIAYALFLESRMEKDCTGEQMHRFICDSLLRALNGKDAAE